MLTSCNIIMLFVFVLCVGPVISHTLIFIAALACPGLMPLRASSHIPNISRYGSGEDRINAGNGLDDSDKHTLYL